MVQGISSGMSGDILTFTKHTKDDLEKTRKTLIESIVGIDARLRKRPMEFDDGTPMGPHEHKKVRANLIQLKYKIESQLREIKTELMRERKLCAQGMTRDQLLTSIEADMDEIRSIIFRVHDKCQFF